MRRIELINKITSYAARFVLEVEGFNANKLYDTNIHAENFLIPVFNTIFDLQLENLNYTQKTNFPSIDIADFKNRVAFQITENADFNKIKDTLKIFFDNKLDRYFDKLFVYIITHKKKKYTDNKIKSLVPASFNFEINEHIIDKDDLLQKINSITSNAKLEHLCKLYEHEFSDVQIELRKQKYENGYLRNEPESLFANMLEISFPEKFYVAELNIDDEGISERINTYLKGKGKRQVKKFRKEKLINQLLRENNSLCSDWILHENQLFTFKDLSDETEPLGILVDHGTISSIECEYYSNIDDNTNRVFKHLLRNSLLELCKVRGIQWFGKKKIFRFANNTREPDEKKIRWKGKRESTKTVIFKMINKKEGNVICFRNLAFRALFENIGDVWFLVLNPTWSFTNPFGYRTSRFESTYMAGIKKLENNSAVYNYFRFFGYFLSINDLFTVEYPYMKILSPVKLSFTPKLDENIWHPIKTVNKIQAEELEDNELNLSLFD